MARQQSSAGAGATGVPRQVTAAVALFAVVLVGYGLLVPLYEAPDEPGHADLVFSIASGGGYPDYDQRSWSEAVLNRCAVHIVTERWCPREEEHEITEGGGITLLFPAHRLRRHLGEDAPDRSRAPGFEQAGGDTAWVRQNQIPQHPPLYYVALGGLTRVQRAVLPGSLSLDQELVLLRMANVAMVMWLPLLAWWTAVRAGFRRRVAVTASFVPLAVPQLAHIGSTVNNDNLLTLLGAVLVALLAGVARGDRSLRTAVLVGATTGAALLTKSSAVVFVPFVAVAYGVGWHRVRSAAAGRAQVVAWLQRLAAAGAIVVGVAGWWYVRNRIRHGTFTPSIDDERISARVLPDDFAPDLGYWAGWVAERLPGRFWGAPGWFSAPMSAGVAQVATGVAVALVVLGLVATLPRVAAALGDRSGGVRTPEASDPASAGPVRPVDALLLVGPFLALVVLVLARAWRLYTTGGQILFVQGRYLFPALTGVAVVLAVGAAVVARRAAPLVVLAAAGALHAVVVHAILSTYWGPPEAGLVDQLAAAARWSAVPPLLVGPIWSLGAVVALAMLVRSLTGGRSGPPSRTRSDGDGSASGRAVADAPVRGAGSS